LELTSFLIFLALLNLFVTLVFLPYSAKQLSSRGHLIPDKYKESKTEIPTHGAAIVVFTSFLVCSTFPIFVGLINRFFSSKIPLESFNELDLVFLLIILIFGFFGLVDELIDVGWWTKIILPLFFSFPLIIFVDISELSVPVFGLINMDNEIFFDIKAYELFRIIIIPIYVMVVSNLVNMHSGFNGLQTGLSSILLFTLILKCILMESSDNLLLPSIILGGLIALWWYNKYPARIFEGNIGSLVFGSCIGTLIVLKELYFFGIFILLPHILDFILLVYAYNFGPGFVKFGSLRKDKTIFSPNPYKVKFILPYFFRLKEWTIVKYLYLLTSFFCVLGLIIF